MGEFYVTGSPGPVISEILDRLFEGENRRIQKIVDALDQRNRQAHHDPLLRGFSIDGEIFRCTGGSPVGLHHIHETLADEARQLLADKELCKDERAEFNQIMFKLVDGCGSGQDLRDVFPDCLTDCLPYWAKSLQRTRPEAWTLEAEPRALRQYRKILPRIEFYSAARLFY